MKYDPLPALHYYRSQAVPCLEALKDLTRIPSVSFAGYPPEEVERSAQKVREMMEETGLQNVKLLHLKNTRPYVYGEWINAPDAPTLLLYAHHDVQPPLREKVWKTPAFEPTQIGDRLYARGIADDKAGVMIHIASIAAYLKTKGVLPINVKVIVEGEEETGSPHLGDFVRRYASLLKSDCMVLTDCANYDTGVPSLTTSLRGLAALEITVSALKSPLHSGMWGGPIPDPVMGLSKMLATLVDDNGRIALPDIWDEVQSPTETEAEDLRKLGMTSEVFRSQAGLMPGVRLFGEGKDILRKTWREPSLVINSIESGGKKISGNVLMDSAWARIGLRLVPDMNPERSLNILAEHLKSVCPWGLSLEIQTENAVSAWATHTEHPVFEIAKRSLAKGYGRDTVFIGCGGTIPFVAPLSKELGDIPALLVGIEDPYTNAHSENESLCISDFHKAVESQIYFFSDLAEQWPRG